MKKSVRMLKIYKENLLVMIFNDIMYEIEEDKNIKIFSSEGYYIGVISSLCYTRVEESI